MQLIFFEKVTQNLDVWTGARFFGNLVTVTRIAICYSEQLIDIGCFPVACWTYTESEQLCT